MIQYAEVSSTAWRIRIASCNWIRENLEAMQGPLVDESRPMALLRLAEKHHITVEELIQWIKIKIPGKRWSVSEWMRFCATYDAARRELAERNQEIRFCPNWHQAMRLGDHWFCCECGAVIEGVE